MTGMHNELRLVRGIQVAPGDTNSAEQGYAVIDLLSGAAEGLALSAATDGWNPTLPAPKAGLWTEVPFADGRTPIASAEANVTETMRLTITASTHLRLSQLLRELYALVEDCDRFWNDEFYNQPVFLHWWATGAPGRQYALIMSIDVDATMSTTEDGDLVTRDVVLTIEHEPFWRWEVPPGANPIYWTLYAQGKLPGLNYDYLADLRLTDSETNYPIQYALAQDTLENRVDYTLLTSTVNTINSQNALFIPAEDIPGDAPALVQISLRNTATISLQNFTYMLARSSKRQLATMRDSAIARFVTMLPFTTGSYGGPVLAADAGGIGGYNIQTASTIAASRLEITAGVAFADYWSVTLGLSKNTQRGRFAVFIRARQHNGSSGDIALRIRFLYGGSAATGFSVVTKSATPVVQSGTGATADWPLTYVDTIRLPVDRDATPSTYGPQGGSGLYNATRDQIVISLEVLRSTGAGVLYFADIILMPYDEALLDTVLVGPVGASATEYTNLIMVDNTGYLSRGKPSQIVIGLNTISDPTSERDRYMVAVEGRGVPLTLQPGVDNTIFVLEQGSTNLSKTTSTLKASVNIVPRSRGIRDV